MPRLAPYLLPLALILAASPAQAAKKNRNAAAAAEKAAPATEPGGASAGEAAPSLVGSGEGSIWDFIEAGQAPAAVDSAGLATVEPEALPVDTEAVEASEELAAIRDAERSILSEAARYDSPIDFYVDPTGTLENDPLHLKQVDPSEFDIPMVVNDDVIRWMEYFTGRGRKYYHRYLSRSTKYQPMMKEKLRAAGMPEDLVYLSMIESGYNPHAYSSAAAAGLWQFITSTGKMYDLRVDFWVDERRDPEASTDAALRLLKDLHDRYDGDWYLAWAAYNAGPGRIDRALRTYGKIDFWTMVQKKSFRPETDNYVPKLLAAAIIGKHPERYGFTDVEYQAPDAVETVEVGPSIGLEVLAKCAGVSQEEFQRLNPHLRRWALPPEPAQHRVYVPAGTGTTFLARLEQVPPEERLTFVHHTVKKGETLSTIANRYDLSLAEVQSANRISNPNRIYPGMNLVIPRPGTTPPEALTASVGGSSKPAASSSGSTSRSGGSSGGSSGSKAPTLSHTVRKGETLSTIASRYGVKASDLQRWNGISNANHVVVGQRLKVHGAASGGGSSSGSSSAATWSSYTVRSGDTLSTIASRHGVTVAQLQSWNSISGSRILVGQKLKIRK